MYDVVAVFSLNLSVLNALWSQIRAILVVHIVSETALHTQILSFELLEQFEESGFTHPLLAPHFMSEQIVSAHQFGKSAPVRYGCGLL